MRAVNLIPIELRGRRGARQGVAGYFVVGALAAILLATAMLVLTSNTINERKDELASLKQRDAAAKQKLGELASFARFEQVRTARLQTIKGLVKSRFDWDAVLRELARAVPSDVKIVSLNGALAAPAAAGGAAGTNAVSGPSLTINGCGRGHEAVAGFIRRAERMRGVTRVGVPSSTRADGAAGGSGEGEGGCSGGRDTTFTMTVAYDGQSPPPPTAAPAPGAASATGASPQAAGATAPGTQAGTPEAGK